MPTDQGKSAGEGTASKSGLGQAPDIASASVAETLATLRVNPDIGLNLAEVDVRRKAHGYNEVTEQKEHPVLRFLSKFWRSDSSRGKQRRGQNQPRSDQDPSGSIAQAFAAGDFSAPMAVHDQTPTGAPVMQELKAEIHYTFEETPRTGGGA